MIPRSPRPFFRRWWRSRSFPDLPGVRSGSEMDLTFRQERARVDRNGRCFSVVIFDVDARARAEFRAIADVLRSRMRSYDTMGWLEVDRLALLLPETDGRGAWTFADDAMEQLGGSGLRVNCEVYTYPLARSGREGRGAQLGPHPTRADEDSPDEVEPASKAPGAGLGELPQRGTGTDGPAPSVRSQPESLPATPVPVTLADLRRGASLRAVNDLYPHFLIPLPLWRRALDIVVAGSLLLLLLPLLVAAAIAIKLTSPGPALFVQWRAGLGARPFRFYKLRSMYKDADERKAALRDQNELVGPAFKMRRDPRITPVGRWLRKFSIDEMPQLWNVLRGDMTLVGPRPPTLDEVADYESWQRERLDMTGGLTCIWQVSGRSEIGFVDWVRMDLEYKRKRSALFDVKLLWRTIGAVFTGRGAY